MRSKKGLEKRWKEATGHQHAEVLRKFPLPRRPATQGRPNFAECIPVGVENSDLASQGQRQPAWRIGDEIVQTVREQSSILGVSETPGRYRLGRQCLPVECLPLRPPKMPPGGDSAADSKRN
jgi:hypothetical protein